MSLPLDAIAASPEPEWESYFVRHRRARRYILRVEPDGRLRVTIPRGGSRRAAEEFAVRHRDWVERQRSRLSGAGTAAADHADARAQAKAELPGLLLGLATRLGLTVKAVSIRDQRTRWGSCGRNGRICLNWRLILMPEPVREYVMVHELMHLKRLDHSPRFWALVAEACPAFREARAWLRRHGSGLR